MLAPLILSVVAFIAGHPTQVVCDSTLNGHAVTASGEAAEAWTPYGGNVIYATPAVCDETNAKPGTSQFADGIATMIHEAAHAKGVRSESCAEMTADIGIFEVLRRFYGIPFFSAASIRIGSQVFGLTRRRPAAYQPGACWNSSYG